MLHIKGVDADKERRGYAERERVREKKRELGDQSLLGGCFFFVCDSFGGDARWAAWLDGCMRCPFQHRKPEARASLSGMRRSEDHSIKSRKSR